MTLDEIDDKIDEWHETKTDKSLQEYLEMECKEFISFIKGDWEKEYGGKNEKEV